MSRVPSTPSTELPEISSAGRFVLDCEMPYSLRRSGDGTGENAWWLELECMPGHVLSFQGEQLIAPDFSTTEERLSFTLRYVCHFLVDRIDAKGLQDVCQSLAEFYVYYKPTEKAQPLLPETRTRRANSVTRQVNPGFTIEEE